MESKACFDPDLAKPTININACGVKAKKKRYNFYDMTSRLGVR